MTKQQTPPAPLTVRDVPEPLGVCDSCSNTPALPEPGGHAVYCSACMRREVLQAAAREQLRDLLAPLLGAWAAHWNAAGLTPEDLGGVLHLEADHWATPTRNHYPFRAAARFLLRRWRPGPYVDPGPGRYTLQLEQLRELAELSPADPPRGMPWPFFATRTPSGFRGTYSETPGLDLLTLELPDGSAVLLPLGYRGKLELGRGAPSAVRIPADLREAARRVYYSSSETPPAEPLERGEVLA